MIQLLPPQLANQIAAGEVVERPASVVKELVENCLDAGASKIEIDISQGGHKHIQIRDDGSGIAKDQLTLALSRHATSKISCLDDLEAISSMGFRGEALASISAVSRLTLTSKTADQSEAWQASAQGIDMAVDIVPAAHPNGTTIDVQDLFFNTPARRRFLRTEKTEFSHIEAVFKRLAMAHPTVEFLLRHNGKRVKHCRRTDNLLRRICALHTGLREDMLWPFEARSDGVCIEGFVLDPRVDAGATELHYSFVNQRPMRDKLITHAIRQAYELSGSDPEQVGFVVFVSVDPKAVDVNVHPAKHEVRFHDARQIHDFISSTLRQLLVSYLSDDATAQDAVHSVNEVITASGTPNHDYIQPPRAQHSGSLGTSSRGSTVFTTSSDTRYKPESPWAGTEPIRSASLAVLPLDDHSSLLKDESQQLWLVHWPDYLATRLRAELMQATRAQPLLIPVATAVSSTWSESKRQSLEQLHVVVEQTANKLILKQVPSGWRTMPWSNAFGALVDSAGPANSECLIACLCAFMDCQSLMQTQQTIQWFMHLDADKQRSLLAEHASPIDIAQLKRLAET